ncbi:hypothetical protein EW026_g8206 [Hermanssonia centrifuga]|uniref:Integrase catalytic domain-containing protein n=1 Tax=Hermanssonia centrifuga TaxID=98765 RepID=A0A4S4K527_9APHY|nr:hypothetical protein EW026_g8206 [Hermanssonia centrifuga]
MFDGAFLAKDSALGRELETELYDSGATRHMSPYQHRFIDFEAIAPKPIGAADNRTFKAVGKGSMYIDVPNRETTRCALLKDVLYAPDMGVTLISMSHIAATGCKVNFDCYGCKILDESGTLIGEIPVADGLYRVQHTKSFDYAGRVKDVFTIDELHRLMGHISHDAARDLVRKGLVLGVMIEDSPSSGVCAACEAAKTTRKPIQRYREGERTAAVGDEVHSDVWGPAPVKTLGGRRYYVSFTDHSRWTVTYLMRTKDEDFRHYQSFVALMKAHHGAAVKLRHSDQGGEYLSNEFNTYLAEQGMKRRLTVHDTPEYNGVAERLNCTLITKPSDHVRRLLEGEGTAGGRGSAGALPKGLRVMHPVEEMETAGLAEVENAVHSEELAMAAVMGDAEGLQPSLEEVRKRPDWPKWLAAINAELESLKTNDTWTVVERPPGVNVVGSKWVLRIKKDASGAIDKYKAHLVAQEYTQIHGINYFETFAPVAKIASLRLLLAITARNGWAVESFDFNSAYLNSSLDEDEVIYLEQPPQFPIKDPKAYVLHLKKVLYSLKQGGRKWYKHLCIALADLGFKRTEADFGVFYARNGPDLTVLTIHVDDCTITGSSKTLISTYKCKLGEKYPLTDLGPVSWLLGIKIL